MSTDNAGEGLVWECGPHANVWKGHDARCRKVPAERAASIARADATRSE